jgi:diguanylate cyclase (GGDEF)-like protein
LLLTVVGYIKKSTMMSETVGSSAKYDIDDSTSPLEPSDIPRYLVSDSEQDSPLPEFDLSTDEGFEQAFTELIQRPTMDPEVRRDLEAALADAKEELDRRREAHERPLGLSVTQIQELSAENKYIAGLSDLGGLTIYYGFAHPGIGEGKATRTIASMIGSEWINAKQKAQLLAKAEGLQAQLGIDHLTGLPLQKPLIRDVKRVIAAEAAKEASAGFAVVMIDLDDFKKFNEEQGHPMGDRALIHLAQVLGKTVRKSDKVYRYAGDEFSLILEDISLEEVSNLLDRIRAAVAESSFVYEEKTYQMTISLGWVHSKQISTSDTLPVLDQEQQQLGWTPAAMQTVKLADLGLDQAKKAGKNTVASAFPLAKVD